MGLWEVDKASGGLISEKDRHQACQANPPTDLLHFINNIINARQVMCSGSEERREKKYKTNRISIPAWPSQSKVHRHQLTCFESKKLVEIFTRYAPTEGHGEQAWILPLGFAHPPLGPQNSNDFLFSSFKRGTAHQNIDEADTEKHN